MARAMRAQYSLCQEATLFKSNDKFSNSNDVEVGDVLTLSSFGVHLGTELAMESEN